GGRDATRRSNLKRGGIREHVEAKRGRDEAKREAKRSRAATRAGILEILQEIVANEGESGAYRTAAARLLLTPEADAAVCQRSCCKAREVPLSVAEWLEARERN